MQDNPIINIPFGGFYCSLWDSEIDHVLEMECEYYAGQQEDSKNDNYQPIEALRLSESDYSDIFYFQCDYSYARLAISKLYVEAFNDWLNDEYADELGIDNFGLVYESMTSPREYNFETDRLFCHVPMATMQAILDYHKRDDYAALAATIERRFTHRDGFISHYTNDIGHWLDKSLDDYDHNELGTLLIAMIGELDESLDMTIYHNIDSMQTAPLHETVLEGIWEGIDNAAFDAAVMERKKEIYKEALGNGLIDSTPPPPRCDLTIDIEF